MSRIFASTLFLLCSQLLYAQETVSFSTGDVSIGHYFEIVFAFLIVAVFFRFAVRFRRLCKKVEDLED